MSQPSKSFRILVVDDDAMSRELLTLLLSAQGYQVTTAESGDAALTLLASGHVSPQVVLADMQMPGISGSTLADALRSRCGPATLLLAMSGSGPPAAEVARFDGFLLKPFTMPQVADAISEALASAVSRIASAVPGHPATATASPAGASNSAGADSAPNGLGAEAMDGQVRQVRQGQHGQPAQQVLLDREDEPGENTAPGEPDEPDEPGAGAALQEALDEHIYSQLAHAMPAPQLHQMYGMCMSDARERITAMRGLAAKHDHPQFIRQAHAIKGSCGMLGASELYAMAARLEKAGLDSPGLGGRRGVNPLDELAAACDRLERILGSRV